MEYPSESLHKELSHLTFPPMAWMEEKKERETVGSIGSGQSHLRHTTSVSLWPPHMHIYTIPTQRKKKRERKIFECTMTYFFLFLLVKTSKILNRFPFEYKTQKDYKITIKLIIVRDNDSKKQQGNASHHMRGIFANMQIQYLFRNHRSKSNRPIKGLKEKNVNQKSCNSEKVHPKIKQKWMIPKFSMHEYICVSVNSLFPSRQALQEVLQAILRLTLVIKLSHCKLFPHNQMKSSNRVMT